MQGFQFWSQLLIATILIVIPIIIVLFRRNWSQKFPAIVNFLTAVLFFLGTFAFVVYLVNHKYYSDVSAAVKQSKYQTVEGVVAGLHPPIDYYGSGKLSAKSATFFVNGVLFNCWDKDHQRGTGFFDRVDLLNNGLQVRIQYVNLNGHNNCITRIEVSK